MQLRRFCSDYGLFDKKSENILKEMPLCLRAMGESVNSFARFLEFGQLAIRAPGTGRGLVDGLRVMLRNRSNGHGAKERYDGWGNTWSAPVGWRAPFNLTADRPTH